uniref:mRNA 3'-end-processing protein RNA14 n=1 Tax=Kwoniella bestiolae CBS 10118 TaxID=1296100 RepID=A0A1B9FS78_9TREE|nr:hypothetical protein I302_08402 [Kwoniella bestiolae CBS 10118]OCF21627.1 hypothetical protein I302_08402 [Kwoniella bestiolae CBS 10118]
MSDPSSDPSAIVQQLQTLTDIEGDLADTALAVVEQEQEQQQQDHSAETQPQAEEPEDEAVGETNTSSAEAEKALMDNAEAIVDVLEESIPAAPVHEEIALTQSTDTSIVPEEIPQMSPQPDGVAAEAATLLNAVEADLNNPVLPEDVVPSAHDTLVETANEEDTGKIVINVEQPTMENIVEAATNPENDSSTNIKEDNLGGEVNIAPLPTPTVSDPRLKTELVYPTPTLPLPAVPQVQESEIKPVVSDEPLPEGLTDGSPSVVNNRDLIHSWRQDPKNPLLLLSLFNWAIQRTEIADARAWYEALAVHNPTAVEPLLALINLELALTNFPQVEALFAKALKGPSGGITAAADVSVWKAYLHYIRRQNPIIDSAPNAEAVRGTITKAYEFALKECGYDRESGEIWEEYIKFISEGPAKNQWEIQAQQDTLRKLYQRAVCIPLNNLESLWKSYDTFESSVNKATSKKFLAERSPAYMTARTALREIKGLTEHLPKPILPPQPTFNESDRATVLGWKNYLKWEEGNPLVIDDEAILGSRIGYALRKCLSEMRHFPELWHYAATYYLKQNKKEEASEVFKAGVQACPKSFLLTFALSELLEDLSQLTAVHDLYQNFLSSLTPEIDDLKKVIEREVDMAKGPEIPPVAGGDVNMDGDGMSEYQRMVEERESRGKLVEERRGKQLQDLSKGINVGWIMYMRFARRAEGIKAARAIFGKARKSPYLTWHIFEASAMMEYHSNKDSAVAIRIFELGLKLFSDDVEYVTKYLQYLLSVNDDTNARALFERSALKIPASSSRPLWDIWARYEYLYGDLSAVHKLETRFAEVFPNDSPLKRFAQRYTYNGIDQIALRDLGFSSSARPAPPPVSQASVPLPTASLTPILPPPPLAASSVPPIGGRGPSNSPSGGYKRPLPDSHETRRGPIDRSPKRYKAHSPPPPPRRYPDRERERERDFPPRDRERDRNVTPPPGPPQGNRGPPAGYGAPIPVPPVGVPPAAMDKDRSGIGKPLVWFIGNLPTARAFDGPIFRPDDIVGLFSNIAPTGLGIPGASGAGAGGPPPPASQGGRGGGGGYPESERRYGGLPPMRGGGRY